SGLSSCSILSKSAARYFFGGFTLACARLGLMKLSAVSRRPGLVSQMPTSSLSFAKVLVIAVRYMREREPTPTLTYLRLAAAACAMTDSPTAAAPAVFSSARRSNVDSLMSIPHSDGAGWGKWGEHSKTALSPLSPPGTLYIKNDQVRSSARTVAVFAAYCGPMLLRLLTAALVIGASAALAAPIDRHALVARHTPTITQVDAHAPFMVGNGNFAFTADITGLQTFPEQYSALAPLVTMAQWSWHSFPNPKGFRLDQAMRPLDVRGKKRPYPALKDWDEAKQESIQWLRENPHKFNLGRLSLQLKSAAGKTATFADLSATKQTLDLWTGRLISSFVFDGVPVE